MLAFTIVARSVAGIGKTTCGCTPAGTSTSRIALVDGNGDGTKTGPEGD
jgi:hypothetical protein